MPYPSKIDPEQLGPIGLAVVEEKGWELWSLRDVAARLGVAPNALYRHVEDRGDLIVEIGATAAKELLREISVPSQVDDAMDTLVEMSERYIQFSIERPAAYEAFVRAKPDQSSPIIGAWHECWMVVLDTVSTVVPNAAEACGFALWSMLHGRADLTKGPTSLVDPMTGLDDAVLALLKGFRSVGSLPSPLPGDSS
ncbi:MAG: TetR/AcrR family transcriptional regulator [Rubrobacteraceae bacterium]